MKTCLLLALAALACAQTPRVHLANGAHLMEQRLFAEASAEFEKAIALDPANNAARFQYATCLFAEGRNDEARREFETIEKRQPNFPGLDYYLGRLDLLANNHASAIARLLPLESNPDYPQAAYYLGLAYLGAGRLADGTARLEKAAARNARDPQVHYRLARAYSEAGRDADAEKQYTLYRQARADQKTAESGVRACTDALHSKPLAEARPVCRKLADPNDPGSLVLLGQLYGDNNAFDDALDPLRQAARLDPNSFEAWHNLGLSLFRLQRYADARPPLERASALNPNYFDTLNLLAATLYMLGDDKAALPALERLHALRPNDAQIAAALQELRKKN